MTTRITVLGGYGNFGKRICETLAADPDVALIVAGRSGEIAHRFADELLAAGPPASVECAEIDINGPHFSEELARLGPEIVVHTGGPFQGQDHHVATTCIDMGSHYLDLADDRRFVCDIVKLDAHAKQNDVLLVSGASTVPGLSSVVVDALRAKLHRLDAIDIAIAPGNRAERGKATVRSILSGVGHRFARWRHEQWTDAFGWMNVRRADFGDTVGRRWLANVDVPDLELFASRYAPIRSVSFQAGLEISLLHLTLWAMALLTRAHLVQSWAKYANAVFSLSKLFAPFGTDVGGMFVRLSGVDIENAPKHVQWSLTAENGVGPYVPALSAIILCRKLVKGELSHRGALPCLGMYGLDEFSELAEQWNIRQTVETLDG